MGKKQDIAQLVNLLAKSLRHRIGAIVNENEFYAQKYAKDSEVIMKEAEKVALRHNWNKEDRARIEAELKVKLKKELEEKKFINERKFELMPKEIGRALRKLGIE